MYNVMLAGQVRKRLKKLPSKHRGQVLKKLDALKADPRPQECRKLETLEGYRLTMGEYRALYTVDDQARLVRVYRLFHRGEGYPK